MRIRDLMTMLSATALVAAPTVAMANPAAPLSVSSSVRASASHKDSSSFVGGPGSTIGLILFAAVIAGGIYLAVDDDDGPDSP